MNAKTFKAWRRTRALPKPVGYPATETVRFADPRVLVALGRSGRLVGAVIRPDGVTAWVRRAA